MVRVLEKQSIIEPVPAAAGPGSGALMKHAASLIAILALAAQPAWAQPPSASIPGSQAAGAAVDTPLDNTFRIDIETIAVTLDWYPASGGVDGTARLDFRLRPGQSRAVFNFTPFVASRSAISRLVIDGRPLSPQSDADVRVVTVAGTRQPFIEVQLPLDPAQPHTLTIDYRLTVPAVYPRFSSEVNDIRGQGNEAVWPTLNTPHELARHVVTFRVHDRQAFRFVGSGRSSFSADGDVQQWVLDTQRAVSSYSVMFVLLPAGDTEYREWLIDGVTVRVVAYPTVNLTEAKARLESWLPELRRRFGPFPALHGLSIFLFNNAGGGMEYYGGTITSLNALRHEVLHSYFGCSVVARTYPDSWYDEAVTSWFEETSRGQGHTALAPSYQGNWVGARSPVSIGFSTLAYTDGASIMQAIADRLGGTDRMTDFLRYVVDRYTFAPFTTLEFAGFLKDYSGVDLRAQFVDWLYNGREPSSAAGDSLPARADRKTLELDPPWLPRRGGLKEGR
jgi:hypothetical protein